MFKRIVKGFVSVLLLTGFCWPQMAAAEEEKNWDWRNGVPEYEAAKIKITADGPTLLFSDSPEMVKATGIMYRDTVQGKARLFFHHVNDTPVEKKVAIVFRNKGTKDSEITFGRKGISKPDYDYLRAGKEVQIEYFSKNNPQSIIIPAGQSREILTNSGVKLQYNQLLTGMLDFTCDLPIEVTVLMLPVEEDVFAAAYSYSVLPTDSGEVLRGTFPAADRNVTLTWSFKPEENKVLGLVLADNDADPYARGLDATTGKEVTNYGNYGVIYNFSYRIKGDQKSKIRFNPWGGWFAGAGLLKTGDNEKLTLFPPKATAFGKKGTETIVIAESSGYSDGQIIFSPPGSSNLPIRIFFEPVNN